MIIFILAVLALMVLGGFGMIYDNYRIGMYKREKQWERVLKHEAKKKKK